MSVSSPQCPVPAAPASGVESVGRYLMQERELRGIPLEQIAEQTRIGVGNLRALEQDDAQRLPARVFVIGYVRAYAQAIGLNPDDAVLRLEEQWQREAPVPEEDDRGRQRRRRVATGVGLALAVGSVVAWLLARG